MQGARKPWTGAYFPYVRSEGAASNAAGGCFPDFRARVVELVDTQDLKSCSQQWL